MVIIEMESGKKIEIELLPEYAPNTAKNFAYLVSQGFYDGLIFHRVINGFMIQGGCPGGTGMGGPGYCIKGEFRKNGVNNSLKHARGVVSMARAMDLDSAGSQFFIMHQDGFFLDGDYAASHRSCRRIFVSITHKAQTRLIPAAMAKAAWTVWLL